MRKSNMFQGFPEETIRFFLDLRFHNEASWFHAHTDQYEQWVKKPFHQFVEAITPTLLKIDPQMEIRPGRCIARIHRDVRFSKDKSPYRDHLWTVFWRMGEEKDRSVMYWFEFTPENIHWGLGFCGKNPAIMEAMRSMILLYPSKFTEALKASGLPCGELVLQGEQYVKKPIPEAVPEALKSIYNRKEFYIQRMGIPFSAVYSADLVELVSSDYLQLKPMYALLREISDMAEAQLEL